MAPSKKAKRTVDVTGSKKPNVEKTPQSYFGVSPTFSFRKYDGGAPWAIPRGSLDTDSVLINLRGFEHTTWGDVVKASGGRSHGTTAISYRLINCPRAVEE